MTLMNDSKTELREPRAPIELEATVASKGYVGSDFRTCAKNSVYHD